MAEKYGLIVDVIRTDFKSGLESLIKKKPVRAIFLGVRIGDPTAVGQEQFSPSSPGWPPFMRVNPILDWSYRDVWAFLLTCKVPYCSLYDQGYTSIGSVYDTVPNSLLSVSNLNGEEKFRPAYLLSDGRLERAGRLKKVASQAYVNSHAVSNGNSITNTLNGSTLTASIIAVGDEILSGTVEDQLQPLLCRKLHSIGWLVSESLVVRNDIDSVADEVERKRSSNDMVFLYGGVGPLHSDVTLAGVAKAFGVRLAPDEEFEEYLRHLFGDKCTGDRNEMALLPEGITQLLHHERLPVPLIKCQNVIVLTGANAEELDEQWNCLIELNESAGLVQINEPFVMKDLTLTISDVEACQPLSKLCLEFPDIFIVCHRKSRSGDLTINFKVKDKARLDLVIEALRKKLPPGSVSGQVNQ
ncbi:hypothetical protein SAY86_005493 [Trapa natans]|uniref:FAD synthase n=1 Tax=Trapa natans TaxID=22666 RepID=A0AAN7L1I1_TRANT|nr:hypothetical protein SAY86_005493 [Trapa natans]